MGSRTSTRSWCPPSRILCATPRPTNPVEPSKRILATGQNPIWPVSILRRSGRRDIQRIPARRLRFIARIRGDRRGPAPAPPPGTLCRNVRGERRHALHGGPDELWRGAPRGGGRADDPWPGLPTLGGKKTPPPSTGGWGRKRRR